MPGINPQEFIYLVPEIFLGVCGMILLLAGVLGRGIGNREATLGALFSLVVTFGLVMWIQQDLSETRVILSGLFVMDSYAFFWKLVVMVATGLTVCLSTRFIEEGGYRPGEYYSLLLLATTGMMFMASGYSLLSIWIALELMAMSSYVLAGYFKHELKSTEAALKYFILGALSSAIMLYGISLLYGTTGTVKLTEMAAALPAAQAAHGSLVDVGWILLAVGLLFKVAAAPFHMWTPDVYEGAPTPVTAFLAVGSKAVSFAIMVRILFQALPPDTVQWQSILAVVAALTMIWGNLAALTQTNVKRMLAYSSVAHAGYVLLGVVAANEIGLWAVLFYLVAYTFITMGTFGLVILLERKEYAGETYSDYAGLASRAPFLAVLMLIFLLALTGIPPTGGFFGKFYLFAAALKAGYTWLAVIGVVTSTISLYYYFGLVVNMYLKPSESESVEPMRAPALVGAIAICAGVTLLLGLLPNSLVVFARESILAISR
jgi:NADH-quinone oxidoreductase subunit N